MKMKKLMFMLAAVAMAASVHAASVSWTSGALYNASGSKVVDSVTLYVYLMDKTTYDGLSDVWATYGDDVKAGGTTAANAGGTQTGKYTHKASVVAPNGTAVANTTYYAAIIATYGTGDSMMYYAERASVTTGDDGNGSFTTFGAGTIASQTAAASAWSSAGSVPEPTSGLQMLVGLAGLALRRRRA